MSETLLKRTSLLFLALFILLLALGGCRGGTAPTPATRDATPSLIPGTGLPAGTQRLVVLPEDGPDPVFDLIDQARERVRVKIYLFTYRDLREALIRAAQRGVRVQVLMDEDPVGGGEGNAATYEALQKGGVEVKWAPAAFKHHHEKSLVVDDRAALIATFNFTYSSFTKNREFGVITTQPQVVAEVGRLFDADWRAQRVSVAQDTPLVISPINSRERLTDLIRGAQKQLWLEEATLLDDEIIQALEEAAQRGVDVRFLAPLREEDQAARHYQALQDAGAQVRFLLEPYVHAKAILADGQQALVGSLNLSYTSLEMNRELAILTHEPQVVDRLARVMADDWEKAGEAHSTPPPGVISWQDAGRYVGQEVVVEGEIVRTYDSGKVTYLNFDEDYRHTLTLVIFPRLYQAFPQPPAQYFLHQRVRARGTVKMYEGAPEIVIEDPDQIHIVGAASGAVSAPRTPQAQGTRSDASELPVISWQDAAQYVGENVVVEGRIVRTYNSGKAAFLNFTEDWRGTLSVVIFARDFPAFPGPPDDIYLHKQVRVRGRIKRYRGAPEIIVRSPAQIQVLE